MADVPSGKYEDSWHQDRENKCHEIEGKQFVSLDKFPRFRSLTIAPNTISFKNGEFNYSYSDVEVFGQITCEINDIFISISTTKGFTGNYNRNTKHLIWEDIEYIESNDAS